MIGSTNVKDIASRGLSLTKGLWSRFLHSIPGVGCRSATEELSCSNEVPNGFVDRVRWLESLHENVL